MQVSNELYCVVVEEKVLCQLEVRLQLSKAKKAFLYFDLH